ncbi:MAG: alkylmercury lyase family protein [Solirubrobacteraceae bacterium]
MTVELLFLEGCPNHESLAGRLPALLAGAGRAADVELVRVESEEDARRLRFLGSPTVRVGGRDVEPGAERRRDFGLKCRLYRTPAGLTGLPRDEWIVAALRPGPDGEHVSPTAALLADRSAKDRLEGCPPAYRRLHRLVLRAFVDGGRPRAADLERWADELGVSAAEALAGLERHDLLWCDRASGEVIAAYPFSGVPTVHAVRLAGSDADVFAMCAIDALGIAFLAGRPARIRSRDPQTGDPIEVSIDPAGAREWQPPEAVVVAALSCGGPSAIDCCPHIDFVSDRRRARALVDSSPELDAAVIGMPEAIEVGRRIFGSLLRLPPDPGGRTIGLVPG